MSESPFTMAEVTAMLRCSDEVASRLARRGELPGLKCGRSWVFPRGAFMSALNAAADAERRQRRAAYEAKRGREVVLSEEEFRQARRAATWSNHRAARLRREPPWASREAVFAMYVRARQVTKATGVEHHVDHEIPLKGKLVSGLHVPGNLRIITGTENRRKKNRFEAQG